MSTRRKWICAMSMALALTSAGTDAVAGAHSIESVAASSSSELRSALESAIGGETILLAPGNYGLHLYVAHGSPFAVYDSEVTIKSADPDNLASFNWMYLRGVENITLDSVRLNYTHGENYESLIQSSKNVTIKNSVFDGDLVSGTGTSRDGYPAGDGLYVRGSSDIVIENNEFFHWTNSATFQNVENLVVSENEVHSFRSDGLRFTQVNNVLIENNHIHNPMTREGNHPDFIQFWTAGSTASTSDVVIRGNIMDAGAGGWAQAIFMGDESKGAFPYLNILIEDNLIHNGHVHGITVRKAIDLTIQNNTLLYNADSGPWVPTIRSTDDSLNVLIANNIVPESWQSPPPPTSERTVENNLVVSYDPAKPNYVGDLFVNALAGADATLADLQAVPGGLIEQMGVGAARTGMTTQ